VLYYNLFIRNPLYWFAIIVSIVLGPTITIASVLAFYNALRYNVSFSKEGKVIETTAKEIKEYIFKEYTGVQKISVSGFSFPQVTHMLPTSPGSGRWYYPHIRIYGNNPNNIPIVFIPKLPISIYHVLKYLKKENPKIYIDPQFKSDINFWHHKELFG